MDIAYDHIQEEVLSPDQIANKKSQDPNQKDGNLNTELKEAYKSFSSSPWGARLGGFLSDVRKHGETYYEGARQEATAASGEALKGFTDLRSTLVSRARSMSTGQDPPSTPPAANQTSGREAEKEGKDDKERSESEALRESESVISRFRAEAAKRLKDLEKAEEAADAAIFRFGANIGNFLRDAVTIAPPTEETNKDGSRKVLFESKDQDGKRVIHSTRFDAQLHAIHSSLESFTSDPASAEYAKWKDDFDVDKKTDAIAQDLEKYEELRRTMEKLVPEKVEYKDFWTRYYFLRMVVETEEQRRKDILKGATESTHENIGWDDDSDDEEDKASTPQQSQPPPTASEAPEISQPPSSTDPKADEPQEPPSLKPAEPRRSQDALSQPDSDTSYDLVSGATSRAPGSPRAGEKKDDDEEEDWE
ncbi:hypothetical protein HO133_007643 [Letharia lupina]|uniref:BSD domain-containing protein n=1 Tax=Letharia lupina TaxID=560253 RepID=A0A8H6FGZ3_9LECA|nr:uncharacterized protein HO133_007643 [Letharia lupina]KAF6227915.1 hypothetical protein HO133_007643 [Letharia lupina]